MYQNTWKYSMINEYVIWNIGFGNKKRGEFVCSHLAPNIKYIKVSRFGDLSRGWPECSLFNSYYTKVYGRALLHSLDSSTLPLMLTLIMLSAKQGGIKYHFLSLWYDSTWDWIQILGILGEHFSHQANGPVNTLKIIFINTLKIIFFLNWLTSLIGGMCLLSIRKYIYI